MDCNLHLGKRGRWREDGYYFGVFLVRENSSSHQVFTCDFEEKVVYMGPCVQERVANQRKWLGGGSGMERFDPGTQSVM